MGLLTSLVFRIYGADRLLENLKEIGILLTYFCLYLVPFVLAQQNLRRLRIKEVIRAAELNKQISVVKEFLDEQTEVLQSLEAGIVVLSGGRITFMNSAFERVIAGVPVSTSADLINQPIFKLFKKSKKAKLISRL